MIDTKDELKQRKYRETDSVYKAIKVKLAGVQYTDRSKRMTVSKAIRGFFYMLLNDEITISQLIAATHLNEEIKKEVE